MGTAGGSTSQEAPGDEGRKVSEFILDIKKDTNPVAGKTFICFLPLQ